MSQFDDYSLSGCLIDRSADDAPTLTSMGGADPMQTMGASAPTLPPVVDLRRFCSAVEDQQHTNSCVGNAVVGALELLQAKEGHSAHDLSRLFVYYNSRTLSGEPVADEGTTINFAMAAILAHGICEERMWPFSEITINDRPTQACYANAQHYRGVEFAEIAVGTPVTHVLAQGIPVVIGVGLPREAYNIADATGTMDLPPGGGTAHQHGKHAMLIVGYNLETKTYLVRNSWGPQFAQGGYFFMPMEIYQKAAIDGQSWAIGSLNKAPGLELLGRSVPEARDRMVARAQSALQEAAQGQAAPAASEFEGRMQAARKGFASRLRGQD